ncbi:DUF4412 domain-containing protein [Winogradskyella vidalii]|uniref:DUF4412 domain-containing protein n=1 Tax=Winogradskyella vidalii TaxID=2615024 RepID=UPI0015CB4534|nr:DUF4412 domain-containing protein [Winogradskyella vidalii]
MKTLLKYAIILMLFSAVQPVEAQLFKKLKKKVEKKLEQKAEAKIDKTIDKTIDDVTSEKKKDTPKSSDEPEKSLEIASSTADYGDVILTHANTFGAVQIAEVGKIKATQTNSQWRFTGSWWSHDADIHDGFVLTIPTEANLRHDAETDTDGVKRSFKIPEEATLKLSYDPDLLHYEDSGDDFKKAVSDNYQSYNVSKGQVTIDVLTEGAIQISFDGKVSLKKILRHSANSEDYSETYFESTVIGGIDAESPEFFNQTSVVKTEDSNESGWSGSEQQNTNSTAVAGVYQFTFETKVKVTNIDDANETYKMSYLLNPNENYMGLMVDMSDYSDEEMEGESVIVMDDGNTHIFVDTAGMKMQMSQNMMGGQQMQNPTDQMANYDYSKIKKTGKTKTILGATCYEYVMSDSEVKMTLWVAPEINLPNWFIQNDAVLKGYIMEYTIQSKDGNMTSETIAINDNIDKTINPKDYKKMF